jgi:hypothetical protein
MSDPKPTDRPVGVYLVTLYFVLTAFLEPIKEFREWDSPINFNPFTEQSVWHLVTEALIYLVGAYLIWHLTWLGRLGALVFGYLYLATWLGFFVLYAQGTPMNSTPLVLIISVYHVLALPFLLYYLQKEPRKKLFQVSLFDVLLHRD